MKHLLGFGISLMLLSFTPAAHTQTRPSPENLINNSLQSTTVGQPNGVAGLDGTGKVPLANLPAVGAQIGVLSGQARDAALAITAETNAQNTANAAIPTSTLNQPNGPAQLDAQGTAGSLIVSGRTLGARVADVINVMDAAYGAACDGTTDDTSAINLATAAFRTALNSGLSARLVFPSGKTCHIATPGGVNFTLLHSYIGVVDMTGATLTCATTQTACIDATYTDHLTWLNANVQGVAGANEPSIGFQLARLSNSTDCGEQRFENLKTLGSFTMAGVYEGSCETNNWLSPHFENDDTGNSYALIQDGQNHWNITSAYTTITQLVNGASSFNENVFENATIVGSGSVAPRWLAGAEKHRWIGSYLLVRGGSYGTVIYDTGVMPLTMQKDDIHSEGTLTDAYFLTGSAGAHTIYGLTVEDHQSAASSGYFKLDTPITAEVAIDFSFHQTQPGTGSVKLFEQPALWSINGDVQLGSASSSTYSTLASFFGKWCVGSSCFQTTVLPSTLAVSSINNPGGVAAQSFTSGVVVTTNSGFTPNSSGLPLPIITIGAPPTGGTQAAAHVATLQLAANPSTSGGTGYTNGDQVHPVGWVCNTTPTFNLVASGGVPSAATISGDLHCSVATSPVAVTGGTGTGLNLVFGAGSFRVGFSSTETAGQVQDIVLDNPGAGYLVAPPVTFSGGSPLAHTTLSSALTVSAGLGALIVNGSGTTLGVNGISGAPILATAALVDQSGSSAIALTTSGYTIPANVSRQAFKPAATISAATITLTAPTQANFVMTLPFYNFGVTALTFSPAVVGWTNGATITPDSSALRLGYDLASATWHREQ